MSTQENNHDVHPNEKKGKRKVQRCDLEGQDDNVTCDYEQHGASIVTDQTTIPS